MSWELDGPAAAAHPGDPAAVPRGHRDVDGRARGAAARRSGSSNSATSARRASRRCSRSIPTCSACTCCAPAARRRCARPGAARGGRSGAPRPAPLGTALALRRARYDLAVDLFFNPAQRLAAASWRACPRRIGGTAGSRRRLYTHVAAAPPPGARAGLRAGRARRARRSSGAPRAAAAPAERPAVPGLAARHLRAGRAAAAGGRAGAGRHVASAPLLAALGAAAGRLHLARARRRPGRRRRGPRPTGGSCAGTLADTSDGAVVVLCPPGGDRRAATWLAADPAGRGGVLPPLPLADALRVVAGARARDQRRRRHHACGGGDGRADGRALRPDRPRASGSPTRGSGRSACWRRARLARLATATTATRSSACRTCARTSSWRRRRALPAGESRRERTTATCGTACSRRGGSWSCAARRSATRWSPCRRCCGSPSALPAAEIDLVVDRPFAPLLASMAAGCAIVAWPPPARVAGRAGCASLRAARYDLVIDYLGSPRTALWTALSGAPAAGRLRPAAPPLGLQRAGPAQPRAGRRRWPRSPARRSSIRCARSAWSRRPGARARRARRRPRRRRWARTTATGRRRFFAGPGPHAALVFSATWPAKAWPAAHAARLYGAAGGGRGRPGLRDRPGRCGSGPGSATGRARRRRSRRRRPCRNWRTCWRAAGSAWRRTTARAIWRRAWAPRP